MNKQHLESIIENEDFLALQAKFHEPSLFNLFSVKKRKENMHSDVIAWLLNPTENHGLNVYFLNNFLKSLDKDSFIEEDTLVEVFTEYNNDKSNKNDRIDIVVKTDKLIICIENKIDSFEGESQLLRYRRSINDRFPNHKKIFVYLTPFGDEPLDKNELEFYNLMSYHKISNLIDKAINDNNLSQSIQVYLYDYNTNLKRNILKTENLNQLAKELYSKHQEVFDFIANNKNYTGDFNLKIENYLKSKKLIVTQSSNDNTFRFTTPNLVYIIPKNGQEFKDNYSFLFELKFTADKKASFQTSIPTAKKENGKTARKLLISLLNNLDEAKVFDIDDTKWIINHISHEWKFDKKNIDEYKTEEELVKDAIGDQMDAILQYIEKVEQILLQEESQFKGLQ
ncbi:PD-(D/E)XK nuclease family protein [Flammeovirga sp. MY04]|uniref:PDDEXK-like family protein n=1 Tax=Flammeovirga sp. MY04 TaxID=1191459 RepID=UPI0008060FC5|nr:PD-(D/E)XK nuclease family protein [Flammeovirga sp. MY04]ANQ51573.1 PD-(D/E)XK nuclease family protein [Flammeovirga sp. MY04]